MSSTSRDAGFAAGLVAIGVVSVAAGPLLIPLFLGMGVLAGTMRVLRPVVTASALGVPAVVAAPWLTPRGDGSLWGLVFLLAPFWAVVAGVAHALLLRMNRT